MARGSLNTVAADKLPETAREKLRPLAPDPAAIFKVLNPAANCPLRAAETAGCLFPKLLCVLEVSAAAVCKCLHDEKVTEVFNLSLPDHFSCKSGVDVETLVFHLGGYVEA
jgi:hypothetical protein